MNNANADWLFLRGLGRESAHWDDFPQRYAQGIAGARVHLLDLPGNGKYRHLASPLSIRETLAFVRHEALGNPSIGRPCFLFAISLGGMVALEWAQLYPDELAGLVLVNTSLRGYSSLSQRLTPRCWPLLARILACRDPAKREYLILQLTAHARTATPELIAGRAAIARRHPVQPLNIIRQLLAAARHRPSQHPPQVPLLLLNSLGDRMVDPGCTLALAHHWGVPLATHPTAGHDLPLDAPDWVISQVRHWLDIPG